MDGQLHPNQLRTYSDEELISFLEFRPNSEIQELCRRLSDPQAAHEADMANGELEHECGGLREDLRDKRRDNKNLKARVALLEKTLTDAGLPVPPYLTDGGG